MTQGNVGVKRQAPREEMKSGDEKESAAPSLEG